jgi:hypothetical protein
MKKANSSHKFPQTGKHSSSHSQHKPVQITDSENYMCIHSPTGWQKIKEYETGRICSTHEADEKCAQNFGHETWRKRPLGISRCRWENYIKIIIREIACGLDSFGLGWGGDPGFCEHGSEVSYCIKGGGGYLTSWVTISFY